MEMNQHVFLYSIRESFVTFKFYLIIVNVFLFAYEFPYSSLFIIRFVVLLPIFISIFLSLSYLFRTFCKKLQLIHFEHKAYLTIREKNDCKLRKQKPADFNCILQLKHEPKKDLSTHAQHEFHINKKNCFCSIKLIE